MKHQYINKNNILSFFGGILPPGISEVLHGTPRVPQGYPRVPQATTGVPSAIPGISLAPCASRTKHIVQQGKVCWHCVLDCVCWLFFTVLGTSSGSSLLYNNNTVLTEALGVPPILQIPKKNNFPATFFLAEGTYGHTYGWSYKQENSCS